MYYKPDSDQLIDDTSLITVHGLVPGKPEVLIQYGFYHVRDIAPEYDWVTQRLVRGQVKKIDGGEYYEFPYTIENLTQEEIEVNIQKKRELEWDPIREERNKLLEKSDYTQISDANLLSEEEKILWKNYRQKLRDLPQNFVEVVDIIWPKNPDQEKEEFELQNLEYPPNDYNVGERPFLPEGYMVGVGSTPAD